MNAAPETQSRLSTVEKRPELIERQLDDVASSVGLNFLVFSGERDKLCAAFDMAMGAAATEMNVTKFFTFGERRA